MGAAWARHAMCESALRGGVGTRDPAQHRAAERSEAQDKTLLRHFFKVKYSRNSMPL